MVQINMAGREIVHLATHGFFNTVADDGRTALGFRRVGGLALENPLVSSGLALAGAANAASASSSGSDGFLTAAEIGRLDLRATRWAVLSACETGLGEVEAEEGVFGLRRAFRQAGASTVIMSLWSVRDDDARFWMSELYSRRFETGRAGNGTPGTIDAVHDATLAALARARAAGDANPYRWAAFVASGDWR